MKDASCQTLNRYGDFIDTVQEEDLRRDKSLNINDDETIGDNPNRYKQHGFYFNADNCIACHACEAACSEKNDKGLEDQGSRRALSDSAILTSIVVGRFKRPLQ